MHPMCVLLELVVKRKGIHEMKIERSVRDLLWRVNSRYSGGQLFHVSLHGRAGFRPSKVFARSTRLEHPSRQTEYSRENIHVLPPTLP